MDGYEKYDFTNRGKELSIAKNSYYRKEKTRLSYSLNRKITTKNQKTTSTRK